MKIFRGKFKKKEGKIVEVMLKIGKVIVEGIQVKKQDGSKADFKLQPSNLQITELNLEDKKRLKTKQKEAKEEKKETRHGDAELKKENKETRHGDAELKGEKNAP